MSQPNPFGIFCRKTFNPNEFDCLAIDAGDQPDKMAAKRYEKQAKRKRVSGSKPKTLIKVVVVVDVAPFNGPKNTIRIQLSSFGYRGYFGTLFK